MTDLSRLFADLCAGLEGPVPGFHPPVPGRFGATGNSQGVDIERSSRCSRSSRSENTQDTLDDIAGLNFVKLSDQRIARTSSYVKTPGTPGTPGTGAKSPAETTLPQFPVKVREPGTPGTGSSPCERPTLDPNRAGPQRGDWWNADHLAALAPQLAPITAVDESLPISAAEVRAGVERELRALAALGRTGPAALRDAVEITRAKVRNFPALVERQINTSRCHICVELLYGDLPVIAVLTGKRGVTLLMHAECHSEHTRRVVDVVDRIMAAAGFDADRQEAAVRDATCR